MFRRWGSSPVQCHDSGWGSSRWRFSLWGAGLCATGPVTMCRRHWKGQRLRRGVRDKGRCVNQAEKQALHCCLNLASSPRVNRLKWWHLMAFRGMWGISDTATAPQKISPRQGCMEEMTAPVCTSRHGSWGSNYIQQAVSRESDLVSAEQDRT